MMVAIVPFLVMIVGLVLWAMEAKVGFWSKVGYVMFCVGCFYVVGAYAHSTVRVGVEALSKVFAG